uniref:Alanine--glyoxylate aminotransferase 2, mitochondrial n=1 Tax=Sinocyclocheilus grahami TaxID=75366 RepID=A0A672SAW8_SINGR
MYLCPGVLCQKSAVKHTPPVLPQIPPFDFKPEPYQGMSKDCLLDIRKHNCNPMTMKVMYYKKPVFINQGYMQWLWDVDGRRYLDLFAGIVTVSVGHCNPRLRNNIYVNPQMQEYAEKLASLFHCHCWKRKVEPPNQHIRIISEGSCDYMYIRELKEMFTTTVPNRIAAFFTEPIQEKTYIGFVQTGFGRTGSHFWGFQGHNVLPDMVTMAKGIANGFPMGAVVTTAEIARSFAKGVHFNTFGGNPLARAAFYFSVTIKEDKIQENSAEVGPYLLTELAKLRDKYEIIGDVRGKGLLIGVEMVKDKANRDLLPSEAIAEIFEGTKDMGVLIGKGGLIKPPMCINKDDADFFLAVFNQAVHNYMERR